MSCAVPLTKATSTFLSWAITLASPQTFLSKSPRSMGCRLSRAAPAPWRAMNRRSLTRTERCFACSTMRSIERLYSATRLLAPRSAISPSPRMMVSGVRSSWLMSAKKPRRVSSICRKDSLA